MKYTVTIVDIKVNSNHSIWRERRREETKREGRRERERSTHFDRSGGEVDVVREVKQCPGPNGSHRNHKLLSLCNTNQLMFVVLQQTNKQTNNAVNNRAYTIQQKILQVGSKGRPVC